MQDDKMRQEIEIQKTLEQEREKITQVCRKLLDKCIQREMKIKFVYEYMYHMENELLVKYDTTNIVLKQQTY